MSHPYEKLPSIAAPDGGLVALESQGSDELAACLLSVV